MKHFIIIVAISLLSTRSFGQIGNNDGKYNEIIKQAYSVLEDIKIGQKKSLLDKFKYSGFQEKGEFRHFLSKKNLLWARQTVDTFGLPRKDEISISEWRTTSKDKNTFATTVNMTFFFKKGGDKFSNINDHISLNFQRDKDGTYYLDGLMFFKKNDYIAIKRIIEEMP